MTAQRRVLHFVALTRMSVPWREPLCPSRAALGRCLRLRSASITWPGQQEKPAQARVMS
jgi:hypothetical protein